MDEIRLRVDGPVLPRSETAHDFLLWRRDEDVFVVVVSLALMTAPHSFCTFFSMNL